MDSKLLWNLRHMGHVLHHNSEGKGSQKRILLMLEELGTIPQSQLTRSLGIQPGSASEVLGKLESAGLICRTPNEADHRTADVSLTKLGREKAAEARSQRDRQRREWFDCLTQEEKAALLPLLEKLSENWSEKDSRL